MLPSESVRLSCFFLVHKYNDSFSFVGLVGKWVPFISNLTFFLCLRFKVQGSVLFVTYTIIQV